MPPNHPHSSRDEEGCREEGRNEAGLFLIANLAPLLPAYAHPDRLQSINDVRTAGRELTLVKVKEGRLHEFITVDQSQDLDKEEGSYMDGT